MVNIDTHSRLKYFLWILTLHSFFTGIFLTILPAKFLIFFGFPEYPHTFFQIQGGVFHIVMSVAYLMASMNIEKSKHLIYFIIITKFIATFFLFSYFLLIVSIWMLLLSAIGDGIMAIGVLILYKQYLRGK